MRNGHDPNQQTWIEAVRLEFVRLYGSVQGQRAADTVLPSIMRDFRKVLDHSLPGQTRQEEYALEDGKASLVLEGRREIRSGETVRLVTGLSIGGKKIPVADVRTGKAEIRI